jgi:3-oxoacyl-[acyl-carrier-protein] synthase II
VTRRVVVTGIGAVTPIGTGAEGLWAGLRRGTSAVRTITRFDHSMFKSHIAAEVADFDVTRWVDERRARRLDRNSAFAIASAHLAIEDGALDLATVDKDRTAVLLGTALGGVAKGEEEHAHFLQGGVREVDPAVALSVFAGAASCNIAMETGFTGLNVTNGMSCASGAIAIGEAFHAIQRGQADVALAGGSEAPLAQLCYGAFAIIRAMSTRNDDPATASRPFDVDRDGFVMGEGSAMLLLEERERALARGARIYVELTGYGTTNDAFHMTAPRPDGSQAARAIRMALDDAGIAPGEVGYINAHASSTSLNDSTETLAIRQVFGAATDQIPVSGTKGYHAHALGASGAFEAAICALASHRSWLPPCINVLHQDPACDLPLLLGSGLAASPEYILSNSFGFGGINAVLVFRRA